MIVRAQSPGDCGTVQSGDRSSGHDHRHHQPGATTRPPIGPCQGAPTNEEEGGGQADVVVLFLKLEGEKDIISYSGEWRVFNQEV